MHRLMRPCQADAPLPEVPQTYVCSSYGPFNLVNFAGTSDFRRLAKRAGTALTHVAIRESAVCSKMFAASKRCTACGGQPSAGLRSCAACGGASYCDRDCQTTHWKKHKPYCTPGAPRAAAPQGGASVVVACQGCGRRDLKLLPCACNTALYCSKACQRSHRSEHKPYCTPATAKPLMWQVAVDDANECVVFDVGHVQRLDVSDPDPDDLAAQQRELQQLSGVLLKAAVDKMARRCKGVFRKCQSSGDTFGEAVARNARAVAYLRDNRVLQAKQDLDKCELLMAKFETDEGAAAFTTVEQVRTLSVQTASIRLNVASVNAQVLCNENFVDSQNIARLPRGDDRRERSRVLAQRIVREVGFREVLGEWDRCADLDFAAIGFVVADDPAGACRPFMRHCAAHAMALLRDHRAEIADWREQEHRCRTLIEQWGL